LPDESFFAATQLSAGNTERAEAAGAPIVLPGISFSPAAALPLGRNVRRRCKCNTPGAGFLLSPPEYRNEPKKHLLYIHTLRIAGLKQVIYNGALITALPG
jgi:hypothetical protein